MKKSLTCCIRILLLAAAPALAQSAPIVLHVDLRDAPRHLLHAQLEIPVVPGPLTLQYPKWIPGDHQPTGPIDNLAGLFFRANGQDLSWTRDSVDMYAIHLVIPKGVTRLDVSLDFLATPGFTGSDMSGATSVNMTVLEWNAVPALPRARPRRADSHHRFAHAATILAIRHGTHHHNSRWRQHFVRASFSRTTGGLASDRRQIFPRNFPGP